MKLTTTEQFFAWMEDDGIHEIVLDDFEPPVRGATPKEVAFTWWSHDPGARTRYRLRARAVSVWRQTGKTTANAIEVARGTGAGVHLVMKAPGRLELRAGSIEVTRGKRERLAAVKRPLSDYGSFHCEIPKRRGAKLAIAAVIAALAPPKGVRAAWYGDVALTKRDLAMTLFEPELPQVFLSARGKPWVTIYADSRPNGDLELHVVREKKGATDTEWRSAVELPKRLGPSRVLSAWEFEGTDAEWVAMFR